MTVIRSRVRKAQRTFEDRLEFLLDEQHDVGTAAASVSTVRRGSHGKKLKRFVGVRQRPSGRWVAEIKGTTQKIRRWLGTFDTAEDAAHAYDEAARSLRGANTRTNFAETPPGAHRIFRFPSSSLMHSMTTHPVTRNLHSRKESVACSAADGKCRCSSPASFLRPRSEHLQEKKMQCFIRRMEQENFRSLTASTSTPTPTARVFQFPIPAVVPKPDARSFPRFMRSGPGDLHAIVAESARGATGSQLRRTACAENSSQLQAHTEVLHSQALQKISEEKRVESTKICGSRKENTDHASTEQPISQDDARFINTSTSFMATAEMSCGERNGALGLQYRWVRSVDESIVPGTSCVTTCDADSRLMLDFATPSCVEAALDPASFSIERVVRSNSDVGAVRTSNAGSVDPLGAMLDSPSPAGTALQKRDKIASSSLPAFEDDVYECMESQRLDGGISCLVAGLKGVRSDYIQGFLFL